MLGQCTVVVLGQTKSLDFLEEKKNMKKSKADTSENQQPAHQQFQSVAVIAVCVCVCDCLLLSLLTPSPPLDNIRVMVIVWRLRANIMRTALYWVVWHNVHSPQHTHVSSSYRFSRLGLSHWDPYAMHRGSCLELYYCNMMDVVLVGFKPSLKDQLVSFSALTLLVWSSDL